MLSAFIDVTGASQGFPRAAAPVGVFSRGTTRISGSLSCGARDLEGESGLPTDLLLVHIALQPSKGKEDSKAIYCMIPLMKVLEKTELEMEEKNQQLRGTGGRVGNKEPAGGVLRALGC